MSTAQNFAFPQAFPWGCVQNIANAMDIFSAAYVENVALANAMTFAWNMETFTITTSGSATRAGDVANGDCTFTLSPIASNRFTEGYLEDQSLWVDGPVGFANVAAFASWPQSLQPNARVCVRTSTFLGIDGTLLLLAASAPASPTAELGDLGFWIGTDPNNAGKYRVYYSFSLYFAHSSDFPYMRWQHQNPAGGSDTLIASGTISIAGLSFNYFAFVDPDSDSSTGGTMSASSTLFTY